MVLAVKRKRQSYIKKKQRDNEKENRTKKEAEQSEFRTAGYDMWSRMEPRNEKLMAAMQQLSLKERLVVTEYVLKGKPFKKIAQETGLKEKGVASAYYRSIKKLRKGDLLSGKFWNLSGILQTVVGNSKETWKNLISLQKSYIFYTFPW